MRLLFISDEDDPVAWREHLLRLMPDLDFIIWPADFDRDDFRASALVASCARAATEADVAVFPGFFIDSG